jgi:Na+-transporting NADH:ubiquinone oxidoreductase subunit C
MKEKPWYPVLYMFVATCIFSVLLIGLARLTREDIEMNAQMAFERAVVGAFPEIKADTNEAVHTVFVEQFEYDEQTRSYRYTEGGQLKGYAIPFAGPGFWDDIEGILGIAADRKTVTGIAFFEQAETPGLGARIDEDDFRGKFRGLIINYSPRPIGIRPVTKDLRENEVHAITGATQTSIRLEKLINDSLARWLQSMNLREDAS